MFTESKLVPLWRNVAATLEQQLVPDFGGTEITIAFDLADVRALHDDANQRYDRLTQAVQGGWMTANEARAQIGLPAIAGGDDLEGNSDAQPDNDDDNMPVVIRMAARFAIKAAGDIPDDLEGINDDNVGLWTRNVQQYLRDRAQALADQLRATGGVLQWDTEAEVAELRGVLDPMRLAVLDDVNKIVQGALGIAFELDDPLTRRYLRESGALIRNITEHTRRLVQDALLAGQAEFEGLDQLTARVLELNAFGKARARVIARTELGFSANAAAIANYRASGQVIGVTVYDGDLHPPCAAMIGKRYPLDQHPPLLAHPNCRRAFAPILVGEEI